jgi:hypothetical protein
MDELACRLHSPADCGVSIIGGVDFQRGTNVIDSAPHQCGNGQRLFSQTLWLIQNFLFSSNLRGNV